ncbi:hypothetical protein I317_02245 [Kwoniella heveanensis CBS 569]|nr:hypothetical protein I317_02245 [Kwoniella heveanensis CBS 569]
MSEAQSTDASHASSAPSRPKGILKPSQYDPDPLSEEFRTLTEDLTEDHQVHMNTLINRRNASPEECRRQYAHDQLTGFDLTTREHLYRGPKKKKKKKMQPSTGFWGSVFTNGTTRRRQVGTRSSRESNRDVSFPTHASTIPREILTPYVEAARTGDASEGGEEEEALASSLNDLCHIADTPPDTQPTAASPAESAFHVDTIAPADVSEDRKERREKRGSHRKQTEGWIRPSTSRQQTTGSARRYSTSGTATTNSKQGSTQTTTATAHSTFDDDKTSDSHPYSHSYPHSLEESASRQECASSEAAARRRSISGSATSHSNKSRKTDTSTTSRKRISLFGGLTAEISGSTSGRKYVRRRSKS